MLKAIAAMVRAIKPVVIKEFRQIWRDPVSLGMLLVLPSVLIMLVGFALNFDVKHLPLAIYDQSKTPQSRALLQMFYHSEYFTPKFMLSGYDEVEGLFLQGQAQMVLVIPPDFGSNLLGSGPMPVQILVDGANNNTALQALGYASGMLQAYAERMMVQSSWRQGRRPYRPIDFRPRVWYNPDLVSNKFLIPGLIGLILMLTAVISTSLTVVREKERGTMEQIMVSPLRPIAFILGKTIPYMSISLVAATAILVLGYLLFNVPVQGNLGLLYGAVFVFLVGALGQGLLISTITDSQQVAFMLSVFSSLLPSFLLSGFVFPISSMPPVLQYLSNIVLTKFFLVIVRGILLKGVGFSVLWSQFVYMALFAGCTLALSAKRMEKRSR